MHKPNRGTPKAREQPTYAKTKVRMGCVARCVTQGTLYETVRTTLLVA